jgi:cytosine/adenosine deaminase-related metal-dependent hydrolase
MYRKITADKVYPVSSAPIEHGVVVVDEQGEIVRIGTASEFDPSELERYEGILIPGLINTHCHLELSHMKGKIPTGTGLLTFIGNVVRQRGASEEEIQDRIAEGDRYMQEHGIVAVGDISNKSDTFRVKQQSPIRYYTFVENFDFMQEDRTQATFDMYKEVYDTLEESETVRKSMSPHAPYSMTPQLFELVNSLNVGKQRTISIHNQETPPENELFLTGGGAFNDFYTSFGMSLEHFKPNGQTAIHYALQYLDPAQKVLFVHNTLTTTEDILAAKSKLPECYWATCPNANLYIENLLPDYRQFLEADACVTIGTDSLTSNWQLCILEEMKTILRYQSYLDFETVLQWATLNGAKALSWDNVLGSLEPGKQPGLLLIENVEGEKVLNEDSTVKRII